MADQETRGDRWIVALIVGLSALALGPVLLHRGVVLIGDMSFVDRQPWKPMWLGLDGSVPRAVPADTVVSVLTQGIPGDLVQKTILLATLILAGIGMLRLVRRMGLEESWAGSAAASVLYVWNPYVAERLGIGHWGLLMGYAALPWVAVRCLDARARRPGALAGLVVTLAIAAIGSPTGGLLAVGVALAMTWGQRRPLAVALGAGLVVNLPWIVPGLLASGTSTDPAGVTAFAARSDGLGGAFGSLLTFGGIWKSAVVPAERGSLLLFGIALAVSVAGIIALLRRRSSPEVRRLLILGGVGLILALAPTLGWGADLVRALVEHVPGGGLLRDSQKWIAPLVMAVCVGVASAVGGAARRSRKSGFSGVVAALGIALPIVVLPSLAWGLSARLEPVTFPGDWSATRAVSDQIPANQRSIVVLPFSNYQAFAWNGGRAALDPALRYFPGRVVISDILTVGNGRSVGGDSPDAARVWSAIDRHVPLAPVLAEIGVRYVLIEKTAAGGAAALSEAPEGRVIHDGPELRLIDLGSRAQVQSQNDSGWVIGGDAVAACLFAGTSMSWAIFPFRRDKSS